MRSGCVLSSQIKTFLIVVLYVFYVFVNCIFGKFYAHYWERIKADYVPTFLNSCGPLVKTHQQGINGRNNFLHTSVLVIAMQ